MKETEQREWEDIELKEVKLLLKKSHKWKSPGLDKLPNFWLNILTSTHKVLTHTLSQTMKNPEEIPKWLAKGITYLLLKVSETNYPKNYRPITWFVYNIQIINLYHNRTHIFIHRIKRIATIQTERMPKGVIRM